MERNILFSTAYRKCLKEFFKIEMRNSKFFNIWKNTIFTRFKRIKELCINFIFRLVKYRYDFYHFGGKLNESSERKIHTKNKVIKGLNVVNIYSNLLITCIEQVMIEEETNEITAIPNVIKN